MAIELVKSEQPFQIRVCATPEQAQEILNEFVLEKGFQILSQTVAVLNGAFAWTFIFVRSAPAPAPLSKIAVPELRIGRG